MTNQKKPTNLLTRRNFVFASSTLVIGSVFSCSGQPPQPPQNPQPTHNPENQKYKPIHVRIRIGKQIDKIGVGNKTFTPKNIDEFPKTIELKPKTKINIEGRAKKITGRLILHQTKDGKFDAVAHVPIEKYLPGVLAGELFSHWHPSTFAAQAVAARSYAMTQHRARINTSHFDVTDGPSSQMFLGDVVLDVAHRAVQETSGIVLWWNSKIVPAYYSACCGGIAAAAKDAISDSNTHDIPPLFGHDGKDCCVEVDSHKWSLARPARTLRKRLNAASVALKIPELAKLRTIRSIEPTERNHHGRPTKLSILSRNNEIISVRATDVMRAANATVESLPNPKKQLRSSFLTAKKIGSNIQIDGLGMGHGVGLCQYGAQVLAGRGETWQNILGWYYPESVINT